MPHCQLPCIIEVRGYHGKVNNQLKGVIRFGSKGIGKHDDSA
jgi:hypothetical protein